MIPVIKSGKMAGSFFVSQKLTGNGNKSNCY
jgi:hypothetical protein